MILVLWPTPPHGPVTKRHPLRVSGDQERAPRLFGGRGHFSEALYWRPASRAISTQGRPPDVSSPPSSRLSSSSISANAKLGKAAERHVENVVRLELAPTMGRAREPVHRLLPVSRSPRDVDQVAAMCRRPQDCLNYFAAGSVARLQDLLVIVHSSS
jgi:hypothetical protein